MWLLSGQSTLVAELAMESYLKTSSIGVAPEEALTMDSVVVSLRKAIMIVIIFEAQVMCVLGGYRSAFSRAFERFASLVLPRRSARSS